MTWLIVAGLLILAFAPVLWLMPSKRDRQLVKLREQARREGLIVEVTALPKREASARERVGADGVARDVTQSCSAYRLPASRSSRGAPCWFLLRDPDGAMPLNGWAAHPEVKLPAVDADYWRDLGAAVAGLEEHCIGMRATESGASWYWLENSRGREATELVSEIAGRLRAVALLQARFETFFDEDD